MLTPKIIVAGRIDLETLKVEHVGSSFKLGDELENKISDRWSEKAKTYAAQGVKVWDGLIYRLENADDVLTQGVMKFSTINYRYANTYADFHQELDEYPERWPNNISVGGLIKTSDNQYVFGSRGDRHANDSQIDIIGGSLTPNELAINSGRDIKLMLEREIEEEIGVLPTQIEKSNTVGLIQSPSSNFILINNVVLNISASKLLKIFNKRSDDEMKALVLVDAESIHSFLPKQQGYRPLLEKFVDIKVAFFDHQTSNNTH